MTGPLITSAWFRCDEVREDAHIRLFCYPHAGGSARLFRGWSKHLSPDIELYAVNPPGRFGNAKEEPVKDLATLVDSFITELIPLLDKPFALFGHSAGATVVYAIAEEMVKRGLPGPLRVLISGAEPFKQQKELAPETLESPDEMRKLISSWGGTSEELLADERAFSAFLPTVLADLTIVNGYIPEGPLFSAGVVICAQDDESVSGESMKLWNDYFPNNCRLELVTGGHFYLDTQPQIAASIVEKELLEAASEASVNANRMLEKWNASRMDYPDKSCLHELFTDAASKTPDAVAIWYNGQKLTFKEVDDQTDQLAKYLKACGVGPDRVVGIFMERSLEYSLAYIAILKAGGAYMPMEIVYPADLVARVLKETSPCCVLTKRSYSGRLPQWQKYLEMEGDWLQKVQVENAPSAEHKDGEKPTPDNLAYIVMSSGTTGVPKGICCPHRGAVHSYYWRLVKYPYLPDDKEACNVFFVWEMLRPLLGNIPMYIIPDDTIFDVYKVADFLEVHQITRILFTPSLLSLLLDSLQAEAVRVKLRTLRIIWLCGEVVTMELRNRAMQLLPGCRFLNLYSISECHDISVSDLSAVDPQESPKYAPCGRVMENVKCYVLSDEMRPVPVGVPGEVYVGGPCLARGYLNMPEKTRERFVSDPLANDGSKLYRTGDRGRFLPSGSLEVIGRCDFMVKIRGYSVVLGAVEAALAEHPQVSTAVVVTEGAEGEDKKLVAYVVPENWKMIPSVSNIRSYLKNKLPHYAIPSAFILLDALPIHGASGKLDRKKLPSSAEGKKLRASSIESAPHEKLTSTEAQVRSLWAELLKLEESSISLDDNFFDVGGHSLLATRLLQSLKEKFAVDIPLSLLLTDARLRVTAELVEKGKRGEEVGRENVQGIDLQLETELDESIYPAPTRKIGLSRFRVEFVSKPPRSVFLTGVTGFLGAHILHSLLHRTDCQVYCLVRGKTLEHGLERILGALSQYQLLEGVCDSGVHIRREEQEALIDRIVPILGDLSKPLLGLENKHFKRLAVEIDAIIHNGAQVNLVRPFEALKAVNVLGTQEVLRLAVTNGFAKTMVKPVHFVSTNGVFPEEVKEWTEDSSMEHWNLLQDGYSQSKWVAEQLCLKARSRGLPVSILRPGNMGPSTLTGVWNPSDFIFLLLQGCKQLGAVPLGVRWRLDITPVNFAADAIAYLAAVKPKRSLGRVLHVQSPHAHQDAAEVFQYLQDSQHALKQVPYVDWKALLRKKAEDEDGGAGKLNELMVGLESFEKYLIEPGVLRNEGFMKAIGEADDIRCPLLTQEVWQLYAKGL